VGTVISSGGGLEVRYAAALYSHAEDVRALDSVFHGRAFAPGGSG
jgi:hypothetical protein